MKKKTIAVFLICALFVVMASGAAAPTEEPKDTLLETALGRIEDDTYINEYYGVGMTLPEDWSFFTDEELAEMMNISSKLIKDEELSELMTQSMDESGAVTNMAAKDKLGTHNVNMRLNRMPNAMMLAMEEKDILEILSETVTDKLERAGYTDLEIEIGEITFAGETKAAMFLSGKYLNIPIYQAEILLMEKEYYAVLTFTSMLEDELDGTIEPWFSLEEDAERTKTA